MFSPARGNAFRKFKLAENHWKDTTPLGLVIIGDGNFRKALPLAAGILTTRKGMAVLESHWNFQCPANYARFGPPG